jgi:hypothetical protein
MDGSVRERLGQGVVDEAVLLDERKPLELRADDGHVEVVAAPRAVDDVDPARVGKRLIEQCLEPFAHGSKIATGALVNVEVDAEQDERPENDREYRREKPFERVDVLEVVVGSRHDRADD